PKIRRRLLSHLRDIEFGTGCGFGRVGLFLDRHFADHLSATCMSRNDAESAAEYVGPIFHNMNAQTFAALSRTISLAVVFDHEPNQIPLTFNADDDLVATGVSDSVTYRLLCDAKKIERYSFIT